MTVVERASPTSIPRTIEDAVKSTIFRRIEASMDKSTGNCHCQISIRSVGHAAIKSCDIERHSGTSRKSFLIADRILREMMFNVCGFSQVRFKAQKHRELYSTWQKQNDDRLLGYRIYEVIIMGKLCGRCKQPMQLVDSYPLASNYEGQTRRMDVYKCRNSDCDTYGDRQPFEVGGC